MLRIDKNLSILMYDDRRRISNIEFDFGDRIVSLGGAEDILYFYTILQTFLQGRLEQEKHTFQLVTLDAIEDGSEMIKLKFRHFIDFTFKKISENDKQYLIITAPRRYAVARECDQDKKNLEKYKQYIDKEIELLTTQKSIRITRFNAQYYLNILQKVSFVW